MSTTSDVNMFRLEAPRDVLQITDGTQPDEQALEIQNPAKWLQILAQRQRQAEEDLHRLAGMCGNTIDLADERMRDIERAYQMLSEGTRYVYDRLGANEKVTERWIRTELANAASAYQAFTRDVWQAIIDRTQEGGQQQINQATQIARVNDALAFLTEANTARSEHLVRFQGNIETWAANHQDQVDFLQKQLREAQEEIRKVAARIPLPESPRQAPLFPRPTTPQPWRSPVRPSTSSLADALQQLKAGPETRH